MMAALWCPALAAAALRVLILTGQSDVPYHDWRATTAHLERLLAATSRFEVQVEEQPARLNGRRPANYDVLVLNYNGPRWGPEAEEAVEQCIRSGKGMIAVHGVSYGLFFGMEWKNNRWAASPTGDPGWRAYSHMLGVTWAPESIGHARRHEFAVEWVDREHPISRGLPPTFTANDELYHRMTHLAGIHVLATAFDDPRIGGTGKNEPVLWTVDYGRGRVVHLTLGHDVAAMSQPGFERAFVRATAWAANPATTF
ncbi:MAG TPA: ThuA domain-containing protein [Bryobacteraceae bacterium]|nr:ThuA domain-containing protein [Bryobacteraceae bacterium]